MADDRQREGLQAGSVVDGRYRIEAQLGQGGFARVYEAEHTDLGRGAALKVIELPQHPGAVDVFIERFLREARIAANLSHPNIVTVYDYGVVAQTGQPYLAMELLEGWDLEMVLAHHGPMAPSRAVTLMIDVLDALADAQSKGIVHKDLKPSNLFLVGEGTGREKLVLIDFGIARIWDDSESRLTQTGGFTGTPAYFAPEYVDRQIVTPAIDVYQCGLILVEMITGVPAVTADTSMQYVLKHCAGQIDVPDELLEGPLGPVLKRALHLNHEERYADCATFREALAAVDTSTIPTPQRGRGGPAIRQDTLDNPPQTGDFADDLASSDTLVAAPKPPPRRLETAKRNVRVPLALGAVLAVLVIGGVAILALRTPTPAPTPAVIIEPEPPAAPVKAVEAEPVVAPTEMPSEAPEAVAPATIQSVPTGASVSVDGTVYGQTPLKVAGALLSDEPHVVRVSSPGHESEEREVVLTPGGTVRFELAKTKRPEQRPKAKVRAKPAPPKPKTVPAALAP